jgi:malonyl-CoA O-methyltransferase
MIIIKQKIINNFNNASQSYDSVAKVQYEVAKDLVDFLTQKINIENFQTILDIGTGTGFIPELLYSFNKQAHYYLNDISSQMLAEANKKLHYITHSSLLGDIEDNLWAQKYDLVISSMTFQWIDNLTKLLNNILKHSNIVVFSILGSKTFAQIDEIYKKYQLPSPVKKHPDLTGFKKLLDESLETLPHEDKFKIFYQEKEYFMELENFASYSAYTKKLGINFNFNIHDNQAHMYNYPLQRKVLYNDKDPINLNYHILFAIIIKK